MNADDDVNLTGATRVLVSPGTVCTVKVGSVLAGTVESPGKLAGSWMPPDDRGTGGKEYSTESIGLYTCTGLAT